MNTTCDTCKEEFEIKVRMAHHDRGVEENFFNCPHCHERYTAYYTNKSIRRKQKEMTELYAKFNKITDGDKRISVLKKINANKLIIKKEMDGLEVTMAPYPKSLK